MDSEALAPEAFGWETRATRKWTCIVGAHEGLDPELPGADLTCKSTREYRTSRRFFDGADPPPGFPDADSWDQWAGGQMHSVNWE